MTSQRSDRGQLLHQSLARVQERIDEACARHDRKPDEVTLIVVTKFFPMSDVAELVSLGVRDIGESRDQEASAKVAELRDELGHDAMPTIHMVGQIQTKKSGSISKYADVVHSIDRPKVVHALDRACARAREEGQREAALSVLVQVDLGEGSDAGRGGALPAHLDDLADEVAECGSLRLRGVMAVAPAEAARDERAASAAFARLTECHQRVLAAHPGADWRSAGMSGDLELAIAAGATHLRVGSAILGSRPPAR